MPDANTIVLLHFDGADGSTTFTDETGKVWTPYSAAQLNTAEQKFGTASAIFNNNAATYIETPYHADFDLGNSDWTIDFWIKLPNLDNEDFIQIGTNFTNGIAVYLTSTTLVVNIGLETEFLGTPFGLSANAWTHIAVVKTNATDNLKVFVGGVKKSDVTNSAHPTITTAVSVGKVTTQGWGLEGWIDELRISNVARWTSDFTPPTAAYGLFEGELSEDATSNFATDADVRLWRYINEEASVNSSFLDNMDLIDEGATVDDSFIDNLPEISEDASADETFGATGTFNTNLYEETGIHTEMRGTGYYVETISDGFDSTDVSTAGFVYSLTCNESLINTDTTVCLATITVPDGFMIFDLAQPNWHKSVPESLVLTDTIFKILGVPCPDSLTLNDSIVTGWKGQEIVNEILGCYELAIGILQFNKLIDDTMDAADTVTYRLAVTVLENILFTSLATATKDFIETINDGAALTDEATRGFDKLIDESLVNTDAATVITSFFNAVAESLVGTDAVSMASSFYKSISDGFVLADTVASKGTLYNVVSESLGLLATVEIAGETWECYVLNTPKFYPSMYSGFNFNSYAVFENKAYGANDIGIYELTGDTDAGAEIHTGVVLNDTDFGLPNQKRFRRGYLSISGTAPKMIFETEDGRREIYAIDTQGKVVVSSELKSKKWKLSISDFDTLDNLKLIPVVLTK